MPRRHLLLTAFLTLAAGCGRSPESSQAIEVTDSAGVRIVTNRTLAGMPETRVQKVLLRTGWEDGEPTFEKVSAGALLADGPAAVMDDRGKTLYLISMDAREVEAIGRRGEGPGEFQSGSAVEVLGGYTIVVYDYMLSRLSRFDSRGQFIDSELWERAGIADMLPSATTTSGRLAWVPAGYSPSQISGTGTAWIKGPLLTSGVLGHDIDTVAFVPFVEIRTENGRPVSNPFLRYGASDAYSEGFVWARNDEPEVQWITEGGTVRQIARWVAERMPVDDAIWEEYEAAYYERMGGSRERGSENQMAQRLREQRRTASPDLPLFRFIHAASDGSAWLSEYTMSGMPASHFTVFDPRGIGSRVVFPRPIMVLDVRGDRVLGVETDEQGIEAVVVYQLAQSRAGH